MADEPSKISTDQQPSPDTRNVQNNAPEDPQASATSESNIVTSHASSTPTASSSGDEPVTLKRKSESLAQLLQAYTDCSDEEVTSDDEADSSSSSEGQIVGGEDDEGNDNDEDDDDEDIEVEEGEEEDPASTDDENESSDDDSPKIEQPAIANEAQPVREINPTPPVNPPIETLEQKKKNYAAKSLAADLGLDILPAVENLKISVKENECMPVGQVHSIVDRLVVIESMEKTPALDFDTVLFDSAGRAIGQVFDIFGQVKRPYYTIRFNSRDEIDKTGLTVGSLTYCAPKTEYTKYVFTQQLLKEKGSDASWKHDQEVPEKYKDYSDDEEERRTKRGDKAKSKGAGLEEEPESPSRKKHLSFERQMNWNNTYRNRVCKRRADEERVQKTNWDVGWHNYCFPMPPPMRPVGYGRGGTPGSMNLKPETALSHPAPPLPPVTSQPTQSHLPDYVTAAAAGFPPSMSHPPPPPPPSVVTNNWYCRPCDQPPPPPPPRPYQQAGHHFLHHAVPPPPSFPFPPPPPPTTATCPVAVYPTQPQQSTAPPPSYSQVMSSASSPMSANSGVFLARYPPPPPPGHQQHPYYNPFM